MKPLISIDLTNDKNNLIMNGTQFIVATPSDVLHQRLEKSIDEADEVVEQAKLPLVLTILQAIFGVAGVAIVAGMIESLEELSLKEMYQYLPLRKRLIFYPFSTRLRMKKSKCARKVYRRHSILTPHIKFTLKMISFIW